MKILPKPGVLLKGQRNGWISGGSNIPRDASHGNICNVGEFWRMSENFMGIIGNIEMKNTMASNGYTVVGNIQRGTSHRNICNTDSVDGKHREQEHIVRQTIW